MRLDAQRREAEGSRARAVRRLCWYCQRKRLQEIYNVTYEFRAHVEQGLKGEFTECHRTGNMVRYFFWKLHGNILEKGIVLFTNFLWAIFFYFAPGNMLNSIQFLHNVHGFILSNIVGNRLIKRIPFSRIFLEFCSKKNLLMFPVRRGHTHNLPIYVDIFNAIQYCCNWKKISFLHPRSYNYTEYINFFWVSSRLQSGGRVCKLLLVLASQPETA